jgi:hypothetical protein
MEGKQQFLGKPEMRGGAFILLARMFVNPSISSNAIYERRKL